MPSGYSQPSEGEASERHNSTYLSLTFLVEKTRALQRQIISFGHHKKRGETRKSSDKEGDIRGDCLDLEVFPITEKYSMRLILYKPSVLSLQKFLYACFSEVQAPPMSPLLLSAMSMSSQKVSNIHGAMIIWSWFPHHVL